jgi:DNA-binding transcriptional ArsR family regulator
MDKLSRLAKFKSMKPLFHPSLEDVTVESILYALSDPVRVAIFAEIAGSKGGQTCSNFLSVRDKSIPKSTLSQHFKVLREAGLIRGERHGVEMQNTSRCTEIEKRFPGLIPAIIQAMSIQQVHRNGSGDAGKRKAVKPAPKK